MHSSFGIRLTNEDIRGSEMVVPKGRTKQGNIMQILIMSLSTYVMVLL